MESVVEDDLEVPVLEPSVEVTEEADTIEDTVASGTSEEEEQSMEELVLDIEGPTETEQDLN